VWSSQLSVNKWGRIKIGATSIDLDDLDPLTSIRAQTVLDMQLEFPDHTIWLVGELIHVIRAEGNQTRAHWDEKAILENYCTMNAKNLRQLAAYLLNLPTEKFDMQDFCRDEHGEKLALNVHECGTIACAVGYGPAAGLPISEADANDWLSYGRRVFGISPGSETWGWLFSGAWAWKDNTPVGAARRIVHLVEHGLPENAEQQRRGMAPYLFEAT
jgi:hypothetical protein